MLLTVPVYEHRDAVVRVDERGNGRRLISVEPASHARGGPSAVPLTWETGYATELIEEMLRLKGPLWLCDHIRREEDSAFVDSWLLAILSYIDESASTGKRLLDLGSGTGASTLNLGRTFPTAEIVGVELVEHNVELARMLARFYNAQNVSFVHNPNGSRLPDNIGEFDFIILSAVYEHLLPDERKTLIPLLWSHLRPGGVLFVNQLPHRYSPIEAHTTGLPLINYLPDGWTAYVARRFSDQIADDEAWETMLRRGIRGGTATEILDRIGESPDLPTLLEPSRLGINDRVELWCALSSGSRWPKIKSGVKVALKALRRATGITFVPVLSLGIQKQPIDGAAEDGLTEL